MKLLARLSRVLTLVLAFALRRPWRGEGGPEALRRLFERLGGTFLKLGQMLALQPDRLPRRYCNALYDLLDRVPPFGYDEVERIFGEELGKAPEDVFDHFERSPMASASIGQVYRASLAECDWAVKVQRPTVHADFRRDLRILALLLAAIRLLPMRSLVWLQEPLSEFAEWTREELDYRIEARYMQLVGKAAGTSPRERAPDVDWERTTRRLLTAELLDGPTLLDHLRDLENGTAYCRSVLTARGFGAETFARNFVDNFLEGVFERGLFHADLHPANLLILEDNRVGYVDFGITGMLSIYSRRRLVAMTLAMVHKDLGLLAREFFRISRMGKKADRQLFRDGLERLARDWYDADDRLEANFTTVMLEMARLSRRADIYPQREVLKYIRSVIAADGLIRRFAPSFDLDAQLRTTCLELLRDQSLDELLEKNRLLRTANATVSLLATGWPRLAERLDEGGAKEEERTSADATGPGRLAVAWLGLSALAFLPLGSGPATWALRILLGASLLLLVLQTFVWLWESRS